MGWWDVMSLYCWVSFGFVLVVQCGMRLRGFIVGFVMQVMIRCMVD